MLYISAGRPAVLHVWADFAKRGLGDGASANPGAGGIRMRSRGRAPLCSKAFLGEWSPPDRKAVLRTSPYGRVENGPVIT
jgi:hypothetical protein